MNFFAAICRPGLITSHQLPGSIPVLAEPDDPRPIGIAHCLNWGTDGPALWQLTVRSQRLGGRWMIIDGEFIPAPPPAAQVGAARWLAASSVGPGRGGRPEDQFTSGEIRGASSPRQDWIPCGRCTGR